MFFPALLGNLFVYNNIVIVVVVVAAVAAAATAILLQDVTSEK